MTRSSSIRLSCSIVGGIARLNCFYATRFTNAPAPCARSREPQYASLSFCFHCLLSLLFHKHSLSHNCSANCATTFASSYCALHNSSRPVLCTVSSQFALHKLLFATHSHFSQESQLALHFSQLALHNLLSTPCYSQLVLHILSQLALRNLLA